MDNHKRTLRYVDPLEVIWMRLVRELGWTIERSADVYASFDGRNVLTLGGRESLDPDDCLAQMVFHEVCHALVEGDRARDSLDWGLENRTDEDIWKEHACLRLQARLGGRFGLRRFLAPTTEHRPFYDGLGEDPLLPRLDKSSVAARLGYSRSFKAPWAPHVQRALEQTASVVRVAREASTEEDLLLFRELESVPTRHPLASRQPPGRVAKLAPISGRARNPCISPSSPLDDTPVSPRLADEKAKHSVSRHARSGVRQHDLDVSVDALEEEQCNRCVWSYRSGSDGVLHCRSYGGVELRTGEPACERFEATVDCQNCGACCREAYDRVELCETDALVRLRPSKVSKDNFGLFVVRDEEQCSLLNRMENEPRFSCSVYADRPQSCRDFESGGAHCLEARRRTGLSD